MKTVLLSILLISVFNFSFCQNSETQVFEVAANVKIFLSSDLPVANLEGENRYIQIGMLGNNNDVNELVGYMDRYIVNDQDMIASVDGTISNETIDYYKFFLNPLYDANNFQQMLEMFKIKNFYVGTAEYPISQFSNTIYARIKSGGK